MPPIISRWIPLACVILASYFLWSASRVPPNMDQDKSPTRLRSPLPPSDYVVPPGLKDPFELQTGVGGASPAAAPGKEAAVKKPRGPAPVHLEGILWDPAHPLAIVNGKILGKGQKGESFEILEIFPDGVRISNGGKVVEKRLEKVR
jgi:hypothetical protein